MSNIATLKADLATHVGALVAELLPGGRREGNNWIAGSVAGNRGRSLSVPLAGPALGLWRDFATGEHGDLIALIMACRGLGFRGACQWARDWLGRPHDWASEPAGPQDGTEAAGKAGSREWALRIWQASRPIAGTDAEAYLCGRSISLPAWPDDLRFHPNLKHKPSGRRFGALVALVRDADGNPAGIQRTYLAPGGAGKAPVDQPKMSLGAVGGGAIRLAEATNTVLLTEGVEDGLSALMAWPYPVWVAPGVTFLKAMRLPQAVRTVILAADADEVGKRAMGEAARRFLTEGRCARLVRLPAGIKDLNDLLRREVGA